MKHSVNLAWRHVGPAVTRLAIMPLCNFNTVLPVAILLRARDKTNKINHSIKIESESGITLVIHSSIKNTKDSLSIPIIQYKYLWRRRKTISINYNINEQSIIIKTSILYRFFSDIFYVHNNIYLEKWKAVFPKLLFLIFTKSISIFKTKSKYNIRF